MRLVLLWVLDVVIGQNPCQRRLKSYWLFGRFHRATLLSAPMRKIPGGLGTGPPVKAKLSSVHFSLWFLPTNSADKPKITATLALSRRPKVEYFVESLTRSAASVWSHDSMLASSYDEAIGT